MEENLDNTTKISNPEEVTPDGNKNKKKTKEIISWAIVLFGAFIIAFIINSNVYAMIRVDQSSMENTLLSNQRLIEDIISYKFKSPERGDIIIFYPDEEKGSMVDDFTHYVDKLAANLRRDSDAEDPHQRYIKRVIGIEGDIIEIKDGSVYRNGEKLEETYVKGTTSPKGMISPVTVGKGQLFVLGDNRKVSTDSRELGLIDINQVEGKAIFRIYPFSKMGNIN